jgi:hypothetical protein
MALVAFENALTLNAIESRLRRREAPRGEVESSDQLGIEGEIMRFVICGGRCRWRLHGLFPQSPGDRRRGDRANRGGRAASGKAGGFLALDWCAGTPLDAWARRRF